MSEQDTVGRADPAEAGTARVTASLGRYIAGLIVAQCLSFMALFTPILISLSVRVGQLDPGHRTASLSRVLAVGAVLAMIANPLFGALSDRTTSRFGRRRPWLLAGALLAALGTLVCGTAADLGTLTAGWALTQLGANAVFAALLATVPDRVPVHLQGRVSGAVGMTLYMAMVLGTVIAQPLVGSTLLLFLVPGLLGLAGVTVLVWIMRDDAPADPAALPPFRWGGLVRSLWVSPRRHPDFAWNLCGRFLMFCGISTMTGYQFYFAVDRLGQSVSGASATVAVAAVVTMAGTAIGSLGGGWLSDRSGRRKIFVFIGALVSVAGLALTAYAHTTASFYTAVAVFSLGLGSYMAVDTALAIAVLPDRAEAAKDLGVLNIGNALPQSLIPALAPAFLAIGSTAGTNYAALYLFGAVCACAGAFAIHFVRAVR
ncbi:MFS transporter [Streptomyces humi]|uniref:MFS transporter n=1 Tax=Streptomyces humi TaxID=1428620 RepID=UPI0006288BFF|nr:MFS transporter [Streptomyces humi]